MNTYVLLALTLLISIGAQFIWGNFPVDFFAFPLNLILAVLWIFFLWFVYQEKRHTVWIKQFLSLRMTAWTILLFIVGCLIIGLFPQLTDLEASQKEGIAGLCGCYNFMSSWTFVAILLWLLTHLGLITIRRIHSKKKHKWRFFLNHAGLWLTLFAGFFGGADEEVLRIPVYRDFPNQEAYSENKEITFLKDSFQLIDFQVEYYPNGMPQHYQAHIHVANQNILLEVNHPYSLRWGEDLYLTGYDMQHSSPNYCIVQIVKQPWKYLLLIGIIMTLSGALLLFLEGPDSSKRNRNKDFN